MKERVSEIVRLPLAVDGALCGTACYTGKIGPAAVLFVHGFGSTRAGAKAEAIEAACASRGWTFAAFDFRGHGESGGSLLNLRASALQEDLEQVRNLPGGPWSRQTFLGGLEHGRLGGRVVRPQTPGHSVGLRVHGTGVQVPGWPLVALE